MSRTKICNREFHFKLYEVFELIKSKNIFENAGSYIKGIEFEKRGLVDVQIISFLDGTSMNLLIDLVHVDEMVRAQLLKSVKSCSETNY